MKYLLICLILVGFSGCRTGGGSGGYFGPPQYEMAVRDAINTAIAELQPVTDRELVFRWDKWRYGVKLVPKTGQSRRGSPFIEINGTPYCGYYSQSVIYFADGVAWETVVHEAGHLVLDRNGYPVQNHHDMFPAFFMKKWTCP